LTLRPGARLGPYEITASIGEGGMGEVYRAKDTSLDRDVAIKVLPESFARDADRVARFTREAKTLAALSHPNIAHVHGLEESAGVRALVMELVDGEDLSVLIERGPMAPADALPIAKQIADALEAAHEQGIIHRDLKPANIKVRADGTVKVLDFGLAKALDPASPSSVEAMNSPTLTERATRMGVIIGTAAYMAPEQARGKAVDRRADIWAFGVVLYEMLSGRRAFGGDDISVTLANVIKEDVNWSALPRDLPPSVGHLLQRCLEKDPKQRLRDIGEARILLEHAGHDQPATRERPAVRTHLVWATVVVAAVVLTATTLSRTGGNRSDPAVQRLELMLPAETMNLGGPEISPDGRQIAVVVRGNDGVRRLWVRAMDELVFHVLAGTEGASFPFWSPDSHALAFFADDMLKKLAVSGGPPQPLCPAPRARGGTWGHGGRVLFSATIDGAERLHQVAETGGTSSVVTPIDLPKAALIRFPAFLPDGRHFLFFFSARRTDTDGAYVGSLDGGGATRLIPGFTQARYSDGWLFFVRSTTLMAQPFDPSHLSLGAGDAVPVVSSIAEGANESSKAFSVSDNGVLIALPLADTKNQLRWFDRTGRPAADLGTPNDHVNPRISPNGARVVTASARGGVQETGGALWLTDTNTGSTQRLTFVDGEYASPIWATDASIIVARATVATGLFDLFQQPTNGAATDEPLNTERVHKAPQDISADARHLLYVTVPSQSAVELRILSLPDRKPSPYLKNANFARLSPIGGWVAYTSGASGSEVYVQSFPVPDKKFPVSNGSGELPVWSRDGRELFYQAGRKLMAVDIAVVADGLSLGQPKALFDLPLGSGTGLTVDYDVAPDGRFLFNVPVERQTPRAIVTLNWKTGLRK
jgi:hypothetical protein